jgi:heme/copper-type cytochrome/quinol oxidase subunit 4
LKFQKQGATSKAHGNQHPEHDSNSENFRSHETGFTINIYLTIFPAKFGASS